MGGEWSCSASFLIKAECCFSSLQQKCLLSACTRPHTIYSTQGIKLSLSEGVILTAAAYQWHPMTHTHTRQPGSRALWVQLHHSSVNSECVLCDSKSWIMTLSVMYRCKLAIHDLVTCSNTLLDSKQAITQNISAKSLTINRNNWCNLSSLIYWGCLGLDWDEGHRLLIGRQLTFFQTHGVFFLNDYWILAEGTSALLPPLTLCKWCREALRLWGINILTHKHTHTAASTHTHTRTPT